MGFALGDYAWAFSLKELIASMISFHSFGLKMSAIVPQAVSGVFRNAVLSVGVGSECSLSI